MQTNIRQPLFEGRCAVLALWFDLTLLDEAEARRRILAHWKAGARLFHVQQGYLLEWPQAAWHRVDALDALALCEVGHVFSSAPLTPAELAQLPLGAYWLVRGAHALAATPDARVDPSTWLDLSAIALREPLPFPRGATGPALVLPAEATPLREILDAIPAASPERAAFLRKSAQARKDGKPERANGVAGAAMAAGAVGLGVLGLLASWVGSLLPAASGATSNGKPRATELSPLAQRLAGLVARLSMLTRISKLMGWRQAMYLRKMLELFENGDLEEALRHAIPIDAVNEGEPRPAFGTPRARTKLEVTAPDRIGGAIGVDGGLAQHLRATYRRSFERLDRQGKIDEAAFVLAELLQCGTEAVTYLEKKKRFEQAAKLADTMALPAEIRIRQWALAGDLVQVVRLARLHNEFAVAVHALEQKQSALAAPLRRHWADYLAARGDLVEAIDVIWPLPDHHALALACLLQAERAGGTLGMRALARKLALLPDSLRASAAAIAAVLAADGEDGAQLRVRLARELLLVAPRTVPVKRVAAALVRIVIPERMAGMNTLDDKELKKLVELADSPMLRADLPTVKAPPDLPKHPLARRGDPLALALDERALLSIHDAVGLPDGQYLLALGEGGIVRIGRNGKQVAQYPVPAHHLVIADNGLRALALARRDKTYRISRLDLITGKVADWLCLPLAFWSGRFDGVTWNTVLERRLAAIDTTAEQLTVSWQVADLPGTVIGYSEASLSQTVLMAGADGLEQWTYAVPGRQLRRRDGYKRPDDSVWKVLPNPATGPLILLRRLCRDGQMTLKMEWKDIDGGTDVARQDIDMGAETDDVSVVVQGAWLLIVAQAAGAARCVVASLNDNKVRAIVTLSHADHACMRVQGDHVLLFDRAGRLVDIDCTDGRVVTHSLS